MADHDDAQDYTANGPTDVGFRTGGDDTGITTGVVAAGTEFGVVGTGVLIEGSPFRPIGVLGMSDVADSEITGAGGAVAKERAK